MTRHWLPAIAITAVLSAGCFEFFNKTEVADPSDITVSLLGGLWNTSSSNAGTLAANCTNFTWSVTETSGNSGSGTFSATCFGTMQVSGTASGTIDGNTLTWTATATANIPDFPNCQVQLSGTATLVGDTITIPYSGTTCLGPVDGTEVLKKTS